MTQLLFREDAYLRECEATVTGVDDGAVTLDRTVFYPLGGGQPGDSGVLSKEAVTAALQALVDGDHGIGTRWITDEQLEAQPELVRTMSVKPPRGAGRVRLLSIDGVDLQPCGGTHLRSTGEVGAVRVSKVEKKGRHNRRVHIVLDS